MDFFVFIVGLYIKPDCAAVSLLLQLIRHRINPSSWSHKPLLYDEDMQMKNFAELCSDSPGGYKQSHDTVHDGSNF